MAYIEIDKHSDDLFGSYQSSLWDILNSMKSLYPQLALEKIRQEADVVAIFRKFFARQAV